MSRPEIIRPFDADSGVSDVGLAEFLGTLHDGISVFGRDMRLKYVNTRLIDMLDMGQITDWPPGTPFEDLLVYLAPREMLGQRNGRTDEQMIAERLEAWGTETDRVERRHLADGRVLDIYRTPTDNEDIISLHVDVTQEVRNAERIEQQHRYMVSLLENTTDGIALL
ncbi:MAG: PAS-domain containing protein, partial [Pseudomonadota bacterium]